MADAGCWLIVTVDTECDKGPDWRTGPSLSFRGVTEGIRRRLQPLCEDFGVRPTYFVSPEVIANPECCSVLRQLESAELASHLHGDYIVPEIKTWQFAGSLTDDMQWEYPPELEQTKLATLTELFVQQFGYAPTSFRGGRFGVGRHTGRFLQELGYRVDSSVTPHIVWTNRWGESAPDFRGCREIPYTVSLAGDIWVPGHSRLLEVPITILAPGAIGNPSPLWFRPWYTEAEDLVRLLHYVASQPPVDGRCRPLVMMFHNVELIPGASPYPQTSADVDRYTEALRRVFVAAQELGMRSGTLGEYYGYCVGSHDQGRREGSPSTVGSYPRPARTRDLTPELILSPSLVEGALDRHAVQPWFRHAYRDRATRWDCWQPCRWVFDHYPPAAPVLSLGCGVGLNLLWLAERGFRELYGLDIDPAAIVAGREIASEAKLPVTLWVDDALRPTTLPPITFAVIEALNWTHLLPEFSLDALLGLYLPHLAPEGAFIFDAIDTEYDDVENNEYCTQDWHKPRAERRPSEYRTRLSSTVVRGIAEAHGLALVKIFRESQKIPKSVYVAQPRGVAPSLRVGEPPSLLQLHPNRTVAGQPFNVQASGRSAVAAVCANVRRTTRIVFEDVPLLTTFGDPELLTAIVPDACFRRPGRYRVYLRDELLGCSHDLPFTVEAAVAPAPDRRDDPAPCAPAPGPRGWLARLGSAVRRLWAALRTNPTPTGRRD